MSEVIVSSLLGGVNHTSHDPLLARILILSRRGSVNTFSDRTFGELTDLVTKLYYKSQAWVEGRRLHT